MFLSIFTCHRALPIQSISQKSDTSIENFMMTTADVASSLRLAYFVNAQTFEGVTFIPLIIMTTHRIWRNPFEHPVKRVLSIIKDTYDRSFEVFILLSVLRPRQLCFNDRCAYD